MERTVTAAPGEPGPAAGERAHREAVPDGLAGAVLGPGSAATPRPLARAIRRLLAEREEGAEWVVGWSSCLLPPPPEPVS